MIIPTRPSRRKFVNYYEHAAQKLLASGITAEQIDGLREFGLMARDNVTGYYDARSAKGRIWTLVEAVRHVKETGEAVFYVEMDLRNLGGLNAALGHTKANEVYSAIAAIARNELSATASDAVFFRHGGDETCAFLVNAVERQVRSAFKRVDRAVASLSKNLAIRDIPHPKHPGNPNLFGTGIHFGLIAVSIQHEADPTLVFRQADFVLERTKLLRQRRRRLRDRRKTRCAVELAVAGVDYDAGEATVADFGPADR